MCLQNSHCIDTLLWEAELREAELDRLALVEKSLTKKLQDARRILSMNITDDLKVAILFATLYIASYREISNS